MKKIIVLGTGLVGSAMALDLAKNHSVTAADKFRTNFDILESAGINTIQADFSNLSSIPALVKDFDIVVGAAPGFMGYSVVKAVIESEKNIVDISFFPEDAFELDSLAKEAGVMAVVDCGVAPGMSNFLLGYHNERMKVENFEFYVGGLPFVREMPFQYKAPFSPVDVLEEYTREARFMLNGNIVTKAPLSDSEFMQFDNIGTLEAFNTDGLRSLLKTMNIPNMKEKTLRYPGHIALIQALKDSGFFSETPISINGNSIKPLEFTSAILFDKWKLTPNDDEFTVMRVIIEGNESGNYKKYIYDLFDRRCPETGISSMSRTTGYAATAVVNLILDGKYSRTGIIPPEYIGCNEDAYQYVLQYLNNRNVVYNRKEII